MAITEIQDTGVEARTGIQQDASDCIDAAERVLDSGGYAHADVLTREWYSRRDLCTYRLSRGYTVDIDDYRPAPRGYARFEVVECDEVVASYEISQFGLVPTVQLYANDRFGTSGPERAANLATLLRDRADYLRARRIKLARASLGDPRKDPECE